jgi:tetratricopeptide (TPR) repeat protein
MKKMILIFLLSAPALFAQETNDEWIVLYNRTMDLFEAGSGDIALATNTLAQTEAALGKDAADLAPLLNEMGYYYYDHGDLEQAGICFERTANIQETLGGADDAILANCLNNLGEVRKLQNHPEQAEKLFDRALSIREKALGPDHFLVAQSLNNLAQLYRSQGRFNESGPLLERALAIREKELGPDHPDTAQSLNNLALYHVTQVEYETAEALFLRALEIYKKIPDCSDTATAFDNLAELYRVMKKGGDAAKMRKQAAALR